MQDIEGSVPPDSITDHLIVGVEVVTQGSDKGLHMFRVHVGDQVRIHCGAHDAMDSTGERAANRIRYSYLLQNVRYLQGGDDSPRL
jgi:hypothetical protein